MHCLPTIVIFLCVLSLLNVSTGHKHHGKYSQDYTNPDLKISGGEMIYPGEYPYLVSIQINKNPETEHGINGHHICGGILFNANWAVTVGSCVIDQKLEDLWIVPGEFDMRRNTYGSEETIVPDFFVFHADSISSDLAPEYDIVMIHLSEEVFIRDNIRAPAPMVEDTLTPTYNENCIEVGWGKTSENSEPVNMFPHDAQVPLLDDGYCSNEYGRFDDTWLCAGNLDGGVGFCEGDIGGPLVCNQTGTGREVVAALMLQRDGCASPGKPGIYIELVHYLKWMLGVANTPQ